MFKLVVLCTVLAAAQYAAAKPGALIAPITYSSAYYPSYLAPATTTITRQSSGVVHPSPLVYSSPLSPLTYGHFIKKRSAGLAYNPYIAAATYAATPLIASPYATSPFLNNVASYPIVQSAPYAYGATHFIKKRSVGLAYGSYIAPTTYAAATPLIASTYATAPIVHAPIVHSAPLISAAPVTYATHLIKKRSAPLALSTYIAPTSYSHQSRIDLHSTPLVTPFAAPYAYSASPLGYSHIY